MSEGKSFYRHAPVTGKARRPTVENLTAGTDRLSVVEYSWLRLPLPGVHNQDVSLVGARCKEWQC